jgi:hypothetical protein
MAPSTNGAPIAGADLNPPARLSPVSIGGWLLGTLAGAVLAIYGVILHVITWIGSKRGEE